MRRAVARQLVQHGGRAAETSAGIGGSAAAVASSSSAASVSAASNAALKMRASACPPSSRAAWLAERLASSAAAGPSGRTLLASAVPRAYFSAAAGASSGATAATRRCWNEVKARMPKDWRLPSAADLVRPSYERVLGTGYNARVAIINALYAMQPSTHWGRLVSLLLAEAVTRGDPLAWCYLTPVTPKEERALEAADAADKAKAAARAGVLRTLRNAAAALARLAWLLALFSPLALAAPIVMGYGFRRREWMRLLRRTLERAGPAFIKWGQWAATRHDLFPPDFCSELELLHTQAPAHGLAFTEAAVQEAFGFSVADLFSEFDAKPVASGSIGQIHRAVLSGAGARLTGMADGSVVAVKVRHPGVSEAIERDFGLMMSAAKLAAGLPALKNLRLEESLKQFAAPLREQVDLAREGYYLHAFNYNFRSEPQVTFPVPLYPLAAPAVLVESFEAGRHISEYVARGAGAPHNSELARLGARTMLHMLVVDNLVHSDLHPGNILVRLHPSGGAAGAAALRALHSLLDKASGVLGVNLRLPEDALLRPSIVLLDAGMATRLSPEDQVNMVGLFEAFSRLDARSVADWTLRFAGEEQGCSDPEAFRLDLERHFAALNAANAFSKGDQSSGADALAAVLETVRVHGVTLPGHICATVVTTLVLEGWSHKLDPAHSTLSEVKRLIALKKGETKARKAAMWVQSAAVDREILEHVPRFEVLQAKSRAGRDGGRKRLT